MEIQGNQNNQNSFEKQDQSWRAHPSQIQNLLSSYNDQDNVVLT